jgi:hypothetical protein
LPTDLRVVLPNRPGALMEALTALSQAGVNLDSYCGDMRPGERWGFLHLLVEDAEAASGVLEGLGFEITGWHEVDVVGVEDRPGALAAALKRYSDEGRNIEVLYPAGSGRVAIGTEDMQRPRYGIRMKDARY